MKLLEDRILKDGRILPGGVLKVDSFLNHQMDIFLLKEMALEWKKRFAGKEVTKILTIEASGIAIAALAGEIFGVPVLFAKKSKSSNISGEVYKTDVRSFTHGTTYHVIVSKRFLTPDDSVLIIDDFLANGEALRGLIDLCSQSGAKIAGCGVAIEKTFQPGGKQIRDTGIQVESLAMVKSMDDLGNIEFVEQ